MRTKQEVIDAVLAAIEAHREEQAQADHPQRALHAVPLATLGHTARQAAGPYHEQDPRPEADAGSEQESQTDQKDTAGDLVHTLFGQSSAFHAIRLPDVLRGRSGLFYAPGRGKLRRRGLCAARQDGYDGGVPRQSRRAGRPAQRCA